jgi:RepB plasmid partitioning protein/ParB-like nuclease family protein
MVRNAHVRQVKMAFEGDGRRLAIADIQPLRLVSDSIKKSSKYTQIATSIREVGMVEPPVVAPDRTTPGKYLLLDGHLRLDVLKDMGETEAVCLVSTDDEAFTYNKRVNRLAIIQEHRMILKAVERGASAERIAKTLNIDVKTLQQKMRLLAGVCPEAAELLKDRHVATGALWILKRMASLRQIEAAELMIAMNKYTISYARSLLAATPQSQLANPHKPHVVRGLSNEQLTLMERESASLERDFKMIEQSYGTDHLDLVLAKGYLAKLLGNARIVRYLTQHQQDILGAFQKIAEMEMATT